MSLIVSGHDFILDPDVVNNITVDLPSFARPETTATAAVTTTFAFSEDPSSNEIQVGAASVVLAELTHHSVSGHHRVQNIDRGSPWPGWTLRAAEVFWRIQRQHFVFIISLVYLTFIFSFWGSDSLCWQNVGSGSGRVTFSIGNELSESRGSKQKSKYRGSGLGPGLSHSHSLAWDDQVSLKVWASSAILTNAHYSGSPRTLHKQ